MQSENQTVAVAKSLDADSKEQPRLPEEPRAPSGGWHPRKIETIDELREFIEANATEINMKAKVFCRRSADAEEVVQELFIRLRHVLETSATGINNAWAITHTVMARLAIDHYRRSARNKTRIKRLEFPDSIPDCNSGGQSEASDIEALCKALDSLPPRLRLIVIGIFIEGCKAKEVATRMGLSESRLAELKKLALEHLRKVLA